MYHPLLTGIQVITLASQVLFDDPSANFLTPLYSVLYMLFGVQGPPVTTSVVPAPVVSVPVAKSSVSVSASGVTGTVHSDSIATNTDTNATTAVASATKKVQFTFYHFTLLLRTTVVALVLFYQLSLRIPPTNITAVKASVYSVNDVPFVTLNTIHMNRLSGDAAIGVCQYVQLLHLPYISAMCKPYALRLEQVGVCNGECHVPPECSNHGSRSACESSRGAVSGLSSNKLVSSGVRLAVYDKAGAHYSLPYHIFTTTDTANNTNNTNSSITVWSATLPTTYTTASALTSIDPHYKFANVELYLTTSSELYLVYNTQFSGNIFNVYKLSGRVLWSGVNSVTCASRGGSDGTSASDSSVEATALYLDEESGTPRIRCSDGGSVELNIGAVHKTDNITTTTATATTADTKTATTSTTNTNTVSTTTATPTDKDNTSTDTPTHTTIPTIQTAATVKSEL